MDIDAVHVVLKDSEDLSFSHFPSSHSQIMKLSELGVPVMACPGCLKASGKTADDLMEGVKVADKASFFNFTNGRILTLDY
jgi:predicted peroxiredoxin